MLTYRATLRPRAATRSPWQADMLFGQLCWLIRYEQGEPALAEFLESYRAEPPLLFSDGFPGDRLPRPLLPPRPPGEHANKRATVDAMRAAKREQTVRWVDLGEFDALRRGETRELGARPNVVAQRTVLKNAINRLTGGTTPLDEATGGGNLYSAEELAFVDTSGVRPAGLDVSIYIRAADAAWAARAENLLRGLARGGYGAKKSAGYGQFALERWEAFQGFDAPPDANGFVSLSNWIPARADPTEGFYSTLVKYGKLGEEMANGENPFKFPLIMLAAGSCFYAGPPLREWYGRLVPGIAPVDPRVVQYGYAFAVPAVLWHEGEQ